MVTTLSLTSRPQYSIRECNLNVSESLLQRVAGLDEPAMQECMNTYGGLVWSLARRLSPSPTDAEEAVQEIFVSLWRNASRFDPARMKEATFVSMIARRRLIDRWRKIKRRQETPTEFDFTDVDDSPAPERDEDVQRAMEALSALSPAQQQVLRLAVHGGLSHQQISERTGFPLGTVKTHARRGLQRIRDTLTEAETDATAGGAP